MKADTIEVSDRGETTAMMEPLQVGEGSPHRPGLTELAVELAAAASGLRRSITDGAVTALAGLVRAMNCYYSNLIEGHNTHPVDVERALRNDFSDDPEKRDLQLEARAHVGVQHWIDTGGLSGRAATREGICEIHRRFAQLLPDELRWVENPESGDRARVQPGVLRTRDVVIGRHVPISAGAVPRFLDRFGSVYNNLGKAATILSAAAAHHRLLWIHPFLDGNGRVARLMSHAMLRDALDTGGIWSIARGLARRESAYKMHLGACDQARRGDLDGRGSRSEAALAEFTRFFLQTCLDQVAFMQGLIEPKRLRQRIRIWVEEEMRMGSLPAQSGDVMEAVLYRGELPRGEVAGLTGTGDRQARRVVAALTGAGALSAKSSRAPLRIVFPATLASRWLPGLFPEA